MQNTKRVRLEAFSDGVVAIAITLLALELKVPHFRSNNLESSFFDMLPLLPGILTFVLSFVTIAIFWVNHHQLTQHLENVSKRVVWANMAFLLFQSLIPFATVALSENLQNSLSLLTYSLVLFGGSVSFTSLRFFIHRKEHLTRKSVNRSLVGPIIYLLAAVVAPFSIESSYILLVIPPLYYFLPKETK